MIKFHDSTIILILTVLLSLTWGCNSQTIQDKRLLTKREKHICDSLKIDSSLISHIRQYTSSAVEPFHYSLSREILDDGSEREIDPVYLQGLVFKETSVNTEIIYDNLAKHFKDMGYSLFVLDRNYGINDKLDVIGILKTIEKYEILKSIETNGINYDIDSDSLLSIIKMFDNKYSLDLVGASGDWCEFRINKAPANWLTIAQEAYEFCPDIVDQGAGTVEALADEMQRTRHLFFWWD